jgi:DNA-binding CsgD family transcriptional regulator
MLLVSPTARDQPLHQTLSERQFQILVLIGEGKTPSDVAYAIGVQASTVSSHLLQIKQRLGLRSNGELAQYALQAGLVGPTGQLK